MLRGSAEQAACPQQPKPNPSRFEQSLADNGRAPRLVLAAEVGRPLFQSPIVNVRGTHLEDDGLVGEQDEQDEQTAGCGQLSYRRTANSDTPPKALQATVYVRTTMIATRERPTS